MFKFQKYELPNFGLVRLPEIKLTEDELKSSSAPNNFVFLNELVNNGWNKIKGDIEPEKHIEYEERIKKELNLVEELSFTDYFLLVWRVINKAHSLDAFIDSGRGSCAGSLCFYLMNVTGVDPIKYNLLFERFISRVRAKKQVIDGITYLEGELAPDVDINLAHHIRDQVVEWLNQIYPGKICKIATVGTLTGKILIKDVHKIIDEANETDAQYVASLVDKIYGFVQDIGDMPERNPKFKEWTKQYPNTFNIALKLRNLIKNKSCHASGYMISYNEIDGNIPLELNSDKEITCSYQMSDASNIAIKLDLLGLSTSQILKDVFDSIPEKLSDINLHDDPLIYDQYQHNTLLPYGLYQISADCAYRTLNEVKPRNIYELSDVNAISRPGALSYLSDYVTKSAPLPHKVFESILKPTRNLCLYQEQMMKMAMAVGFTADEAEILRKIVGKKDLEKAKEWKEKIYLTCEKNGFEKKIGDILWKILEDSANYSFNLSHSLSTSYTSAITTYLKYKYPLNFYLACLKNVHRLPSPMEEIALITKELSFFNIKLLPPDLMKSELDFKIENGNIRYGLSSIRGVSDKTKEKLIGFRRTFQNKFEIFQAAEDAKISIGVMGSIICSGCLTIEENRSRLWLEAQLWNLLTPREKTLALSVGKDQNYDLFNTLNYLKTTNDQKGKPFIKESRIITIKKVFDNYKEIFDFNVKIKDITYWWYEQHYLGFVYSTTLKQIYSKSAPNIIDCNEAKNLQTNDTFESVLSVSEIKSGVSKNKKKYVRLILEDETATITGLIFDREINRILDLNDGKLPLETNLVYIKGHKFNDALSINYLKIQTKKPITKYTELLTSKKKQVEENF